MSSGGLFWATPACALRAACRRRRESKTPASLGPAHHFRKDDAARIPAPLYAWSNGTYQIVLSPEELLVKTGGASAA